MVNGVQPRPFLKWAGGKTQLLHNFRKLYPRELKEGKIDTYIEPFTGSGAVFFDITNLFSIKNLILSDINPNLILTWKVIRKNPDKLIAELKKMEGIYLNYNTEQRKSYFYQVREIFNETTVNDTTPLSRPEIEHAAQMIFLNRTCFNGLYRVNSKGLFNTPAGNYRNPLICDEKNLLAVSSLLSRTEIHSLDFTDTVKFVNDKTFVYFDPPYRPISKSASFNSYSQNGFSDAEQHKLARLFSQMNEKGAKLMLSNSDPKNTNPDDDFFDNLYKDFCIRRIPAKRMINSNAAKRGPVNEVIITNYACDN